MLSSDPKFALSQTKPNIKSADTASASRLKSWYLTCVDCSYKNKFTVALKSGSEVYVNCKNCHGRHEVEAWGNKFIAFVDVITPNSKMAHHEFLDYYNRVDYKRLYLGAGESIIGEKICKSENKLYH